MSDTKTLPSGRTLTVNVAGFSAANKLRKVVAAELLKVDVEFGKLSLSANLDLSKVDPELLNTLKNVVCTLMASDAVESSFWECAARCTVDEQKITRGTDSAPGTFDHPDARKDFIPTAWHVLRANLAPFLAGLDLSSLTSPGAGASGGPRSSSTSSSTG